MTFTVSVPRPIYLKIYSKYLEKLCQHYVADKPSHATLHCNYSIVMNVRIIFYTVNVLRDADSLNGRHWSQKFLYLIRTLPNFQKKNKVPKEVNERLIDIMVCVPVF